jgi:glycosyl transferase family 25
MLPIYVINVQGETSRRQSASRQMQALGLDFRFFDAFDGPSGAACFERIDEERFLLNTGKRLRPGEIGCYASHKTLWQRCVASGQAMMIMEDDFLLAEPFPDAVRCVTSVIDEVEYMRLQHERRARSIPVVLLGPFQLERYTKMPHCAMCYALTPRIAARLLSISRDFAAPVDVVMKRVWQIGHPMYCLTPYTVSDSTLCRDSCIGTRRRCRKPPGLRLRRTLMKIGWRLRQWHFNLLQSDRQLRLGASATSANVLQTVPKGPYLTGANR